MSELLFRTGQPIDVARIPEDEDYRLYLRYLAQTDLLFLAKYVLGYDKIDDIDHREIADFFVKKNPDLPIEEQSEIKVRLALMPRLTYKTTFNIADAVQWIVCFPDVAIMVMTASNSEESPLADAFVTEVFQHFYQAPGAPSSIFHLLFPEHIIGTLFKRNLISFFNTPARTKFRRDPSIRAVSIEQSLSGWHPDIIKCEDIQDNRNSKTSYGLRMVWTNLNVNIKMLPAWGYRDHTGTRYGPADVYGKMLAAQTERMEVLWKPAYIRTPEREALDRALKDPIDDDDLQESDVILQFPRLLSWKYLRFVKHEDPASFWTQYMNIAEGSFKPTFPMEKLQRAKVPAEHAPEEQSTHIAWRFEYAECRYAAGAVGIERSGRMTIVEIVRGIFTPTILARRLVATAKKWEAHRVEIEETPGARTMLNAIRNAALENDWKIDITWTDFIQDETARSLAIKSAEPHLQAGRLLFAEGLENGAEAFRQLYQFGMIEEFEVASVVSKVANCLPQSIAAEGFEAQDEDAMEAYIREDAYNRVYGRGQYSEPVAPPPPIEEDTWEPQGPDHDLGDAMPGLSG